MAKETIKLLLLLTIFMSCNSKKKASLISIDQINYAIVNGDSKCMEKIRDFGLTPNVFNNFTNKLKDKYQGENFEKAFLLFNVLHSEVIDIDNISILKVDDDTMRADLYSELDEEKSITIRNFDEDAFYQYLNTIDNSNDQIRSDRSLLVIEIEKKKVDCYLYLNLDLKKSKEVKSLSFFEYSTGALL